MQPFPPNFLLKTSDRVCASVMMSCGPKTNEYANERRQRMCGSYTHTHTREIFLGPSLFKGPVACADDN